jgi:protein TonB
MSTKPGPQSYYDILGVSPSATPEAVEQAYRARVREVRDLPGGGDRTHQLTIAYRALKAADKRRDYDAALGGTPPARTVPKSAFIASGAAAAATLAPRPAAGSGGGGAAGFAPPMAPQARAEVPPAPAPAPVESPPEPVAEAAPVPLHEQASVQEQVASYAEEPAPAAYEHYPEREPVWSEPAPAYVEPAEHERPAPRRTGLYALAALIAVGLLALLLLVGRNTGPGSEQAPSAQADAGSTLPGGGTQPSAGGELASAAPQVDGGLLDEIFGTEEPAANAATAAAPAAPVPQGQEGAAVGAVGAEPSAGVETEEQIEVAGSSEDTPAPAESPQEPERTAAAVPPPPPPAAASRVSRASAARYLGGGLVDADNAGGRFAGSVGVRFTVLPNGRTASCRVTRSSGNPTLDATTCNLLQQRLRFTPATDDDGRAVASEVGSVYTWGRTPGRPR